MTLVPLNLDEAVVPEGLGKWAVEINADIEKSISDLLDEICKTLTL